MHNSKIISLLKTFSLQELNKFDDFVHSPFFNKVQNVSRLLDAIKAHYPEFKSEALSKQKIYDKLYPGKKYKDERMRNLSSDLLNLGKGFLSQVKFSGDPFFPNKFLLDGLKDKKLDALYNKYLKSTEDYLENTHRFDGNYFLYKTHLEVSRITFYVSRNMIESYFKSYLDFSEQMVVYLLLELVAASEGINRSGVMLNLDLRNNLADRLIKSVDFEKSISHLRKKGNKYAELLEMYYAKYNALMKTGEDKHYFNFRDLFYANIDLLSRNEKYNLYTDLLALCNIKIRAGNDNFRKIVFEIYKKMLNEGIYAYSDNSFMNVVFYRGIIYRCVAIEETDWLEKFAHQYSDKLDPAYRENMRLYTRGVIQFMKRDFEKALEFFSRMSSGAFEIKMDIKHFSLMCYYELNAFEQALSLIDTYEHFLLKNKSVSPGPKNTYGKFVKYTERLIKIKLKPGIFNTDKLKKEIINCREIANKPWLMKKITELEKI